MQNTEGSLIDKTQAFLDNILKVQNNISVWDMPDVDTAGASSGKTELGYFWKYTNWQSGHLKKMPGMLIYYYLPLIQSHVC